VGHSKECPTAHRKPEEGERLKKERKKESQPSFEAQSKYVAQHNSPGGGRNARNEQSECRRGQALTWWVKYALFQFIKRKYRS